MTRPNTTHIAVIIDRSGSMMTCLDDTIGGFNAFLAEQRKIKNDVATMTLVQFDDQYQVDFKDRALVEVADLNKDTYVPRGNTALLDAIGKTIVTVGESLKAKSEKNRPSKVIMIIMTDGQENWSKEYTRTKIFEMITHQRDKYQWEFVFMGASEGSIKDAASYGISAGSTAHYTSSPQGTEQAFQGLSANMSNYRSSGDVKSAGLSANFFAGKNDLRVDPFDNGSLPQLIKTKLGVGKPDDDVSPDESDPQDR